MEHIISDPSYKGTILLRSFSYNSFVKFHSKKFGSHNMTMLYRNPCYNEASYNDCTVLFTALLSQTFWADYPMLLGINI